MGRAHRIGLAALGLLANAGWAQADIWNGCVQVTNTSGIDVTATVDGYPDFSWSIPAESGMPIKYLAANGQRVVMQADSHGRPPIHFQPGSIGMIWNFFTGAAGDPSCKDFWRIVVIRSPCSSVVDNICQ